MTFKAKIEEMIDEIEDFYETHCIDYDWVLISSEDESAVSIDLLLEYPLSKSARQIVVVLNNKRGVLKNVKRDLMVLINQEIRKGAMRYDRGYEKNNRD
jgi:hypothetical protein